MNWDIQRDIATDYLNICELAANNDEVFKTFKRNPSYRQILEHVGYEHGQRYIDVIQKQMPDLLKQNFLDKFATNDSVGNPYTFPYSIGHFSPTTLRYIKVISDLILHFNSLDNWNIVEIGGGYGGQCKIIHDLFKPASYTIVDDYRVYPLQNKYLKSFDISVNLGVFNFETDLVISNYAFDELDEDLKLFYYNKVLEKAEHGYFTFAQPVNLDKYFFRKNFDSFPQNEIQDIPNHRCIIY